jgi:hypothetical protein
MKRVAHLMVGMLLGALLATFAFAVSSGVMSQQDAVKLSPQYYKVLLENDQVRVVEYRLKPGEKRENAFTSCRRLIRLWRCQN